MVTCLDRPAVVLFRGNPRRDARQKRLPRKLLSIVQRALMKTLAAFTLDVFLAENDERIFSVIGSRRAATWTIDSLGGRIGAAVRFCFDSGYRRVLLLAGDIVALDHADLVRALDSLCGGDHAAIGGSGDGGFYIAGFTRAPSVDWERVVADRSRAAEELIQQLEREGFAVARLRRIDDIDSIADARRAVRMLTFSRTLLRVIAQLASLWSAKRPYLRRYVPLKRGFEGFSTSLRAPPPLALR